MRQSNEIRSRRIRIILGISSMALLFVVSMSVHAAQPVGVPGVTGGPFGNATHVGQFSVVNGKVTQAASIPITGVTGPEGPAGPAGPQGPVGPAGPAGSFLDENNHLKFTGGTPLPVDGDCPATINGTDNAGVITFTDVAASCTATFALPYATAPACVISLGNNSSYDLIRIDVTEGGFMISQFGFNATSFEANDRVYYHCFAL